MPLLFRTTIMQTSKPPAFLPGPPLPPLRQPPSRTSHLHRIRVPICATKPPARLSNVQVVLERLSDTLLDAQIHYTRLLSSVKKQPVPSTGTSPRVVILGTGWAAHSLVKIIDLSVLPSVTIISPRNFFFFTPLLSATAVGTIEFRSIVEPIRISNPFVDYFEAFAVDVDPERKVVTCVEGKRDLAPTAPRNEFEVPYDVLVVAVGETTTTFNVAGARQHAYFLKEISDARRLRVKILDSLEKAALPTWTEEQRHNLLHYIVVGGGPTGCEFAGEVSDFVANDLAPRYGADLVSKIRVTLLQSGKSLLTQFEASLQALALENFAGRVEVVFNARVTEVTDSEVVLQSSERIPYGILIWAAGNGTRPIVARIVQRLSGEDVDDARAKRRKIEVDPWLRVVGMQDVFAMGDCAQVQGEPLPATAQVAGQQGAYIGRLLSKVDMKQMNGPDAPILRDSGERIVHPFRFLSLGIMAYLGNDRAIVQVETGHDRNVTLGGRIAYALWRSVYAVKQVDARSRILVLFDYFKSRVFGRDISQF